MPERFSVSVPPVANDSCRSAVPAPKYLPDSVPSPLHPLFLIAFSALTLLDGRQEEHLVCKNSVMRCWCGYLCGARCRLFAYGPADAAASPNPIIPCLSKSRLVLPFLYRLTQVVLEKRPLSGCSVVSDFTVPCPIPSTHLGIWACGST